MLLALFFWAAAYKAIGLLTAGQTDAAALRGAVRDWLLWQHEGHLYYLPVILLVYAALPLTRTFTAHADAKTMRYFLAFWFAFGVLLPTFRQLGLLQDFGGIVRQWPLPMVWSAIGCTVREVRMPLRVPERAQARAQALFAQAGARMENPYVALIVGASWPTKSWPAEHFAALADWLYEQGRIPVLVGSGAVEAQTAARIERAAEIPPVNLVGRMSLQELAFVFQRAACVVGGDTGPTHLAAGLGAPSVMLMGPTYPQRTGLYGQMENVLVADHPCRECMKRACPKGLDCLAAIAPEQVERKIGALLRLA